MARTLTQIETASRRRADMVDDGNFISSAEAREYINSSIQTFWDFMIGEDGGSLFATVSPTPLQIGDNAYQLPDDFYRLVDVAVKQGAQYLRCRQADQQAYAQLLSQTYNGTSLTQYFLKWNIEQDRFELFLFPAPSSADKMLVRYIPQAPQLSLDSDSLNLPNSWVEWIEIDVAIKMLAKEESDPTLLENQQAKLEMRILDAINEINKTGVKTIRDLSDYESQSGWRRFPLINYT